VCVHVFFIAGVNGISWNGRHAHHVILYTVTYKFKMWGLNIISQIFTLLQCVKIFILISKLLSFKALLRVGKFKHL